MRKSKLVLLIIVAVLVVAVAALLIWQVFFASPSFSAVYLRTGEIYFGKLVSFPSFGLKQVYTISFNAQSQDQPYSIQKFSKVFWGPSDFLKLNRDNVVWTTKLDPTGSLAKLFRENPELLPVNPPANQPPANNPAGSAQPNNGSPAPAGN